MENGAAKHDKFKFQRNLGTNLFFKKIHYFDQCEQNHNSEIL